MSDKFKTAFDSIKAEDSLKLNTLAFLQKEIERREKIKKHMRYTRLAGAFAAMIIVLFSGVFSHQLYFASDAFVDIDINPSVEFTVNRFDRVIDIHAYNQDGGEIISGLSLKHKNYQEALLLLMEEISNKGYIQDEGLISVTLQTDDANRENQMLQNIQSGVAGFMSSHHNTAQIDVFPVSDATRAQAYELEITPAKYLAIQELIEVDPSATMEGCRGHSVSELKQLTSNHMNTVHETSGGGHNTINNNNNLNHNNTNNNKGHGGMNNTDNSESSNTTTEPDSSGRQGNHGGHNGHNGGGHGGKHRMGQ